MQKNLAIVQREKNTENKVHRKKRIQRKNTEAQGRNEYNGLPRKKFQVYDCKNIKNTQSISNWVDIYR